VGVRDQFTVDAHGHVLSGGFDGDGMGGGGLEYGSVGHGCSPHETVSTESLKRNMSTPAFSSSPPHTIAGVTDWAAAAQGEPG
jgi:hypothetical protein